MFVDYVLGDDLRDFGTFKCFWTIWDDVFVRVALGDIYTIKFIPNYTPPWFGFHTGIIHSISLLAGLEDA